MVLESYSKIFCADPEYEMKVESTIPVKELYRFRGKMTLSPVKGKAQDKGEQIEEKSTMLDIN
jgi:hypothetical protein